MSPRETPDETPEGGKPARPYLQPLALAIVCLILISLLLGMRLIDLNALDKALLGNMEKTGLDIVRNVQQLAELYCQRLTSALQDDTDAEIGSQMTEESFSLQEALILDLIDVAQDIDYRVESGRLGNKQLASIAFKEGLWLIAVLNEDGVPILQSRPVPDNLLRLAGPVARGREEVTINFFDQSGCLIMICGTETDC